MFEKIGNLCLTCAAERMLQTLKIIYIDLTPFFTLLKLFETSLLSIQKPDHNLSSIHSNLKCALGGADQKIQKFDFKNLLGEKMVLSN